MTSDLSRFIFLPRGFFGKSYISQERKEFAISAQYSKDLPAGRLLSLDVFRGMTIAGMILVNNPGSWSYVYDPLQHAKWNGWTPTDLIFPFFLFIVGVSVAYSFGKIFEKETRISSVYSKIIRRTLVLYGLGLFLYLIPIDFPPGYNWFTDTLAEVRLLGVLQRIALVYFFASMIILHFKPKAQACWAGALLLIYWIAMKWIPFPVIDDGGVINHVGILAPEINLAAYIDDLFLHGHTYLIGEYFHHDPEGILSTIPAISTALIGVLAGHWLRSGKAKYEISSGLFVGGIVGLLLGAILDYGFPINKKLWSPSFVVFTGGMGLIFLAMCYYIIDIKGYKQWTKPFIIFGLNPIALYVLAETMTRILLMIRVDENTRLQEWLYRHMWVSWLDNMNASLGFALFYVLVWLGLMSLFYRKKIFIKI